MKSDILNTLQTEHQCLVGQAAQIEEQLDWIRHGGDPDYALLSDRIQFLKDHYIDIHRPKENAVVQKLISQAGNLGAVMAPFLNTHAAAFLKNLEGLEANLQAVLCERMVSRDDLLRRGDKALYHLREQVTTEEAGPFPWARRRLKARDWKDVARAKESIPWNRQGADCSKAGALFPRLARKTSPGTTSMEATREPCAVLGFTEQEGGY